MVLESFCQAGEDKQPSEESGFFQLRCKSLLMFSLLLLLLLEKRGYGCFPFPIHIALLPFFSLQENGQMGENLSTGCFFFKDASDAFHGIEGRKGSKRREGAKPIGIRRCEGLHCIALEPIGGKPSCSAEEI